MIFVKMVRRRQLSVMETARAIKRLYELKGIDREGGSPDTVSRVNDVSKETNMHPKKVQRLRTLADLIPELAGMLERVLKTQYSNISVSNAGSSGSKSGPRS